MASTLLFVHGTGVRGAALAATLDLLRSQASEFLPGWKIEACNWGDAFGAVPNRRGASVHGYAASGDASARLSAQERARWILLADDPLLELRLAPTPSFIGARPGLKVWDRLRALRDHPDVLALLADVVPAGQWQALIDEIRGDAAWQQVVQGLTLLPPAASPLVARALVAALQVVIRDQGLPAIGVTVRNQLAGLLQSPLGGPPAAGITDWLLGRLTAYGREHRGQITDITSPAVGDILRYQARGESVRGLIGHRIAETGARAVLAHSLGGIAAVDWLAMDARPVEALVTVGSQSAYFYEIDALASLPLGTPMPKFFPRRWLNVYDPSDMLGYPAGGIFRGAVEDLVVDNGEPFPESHSAYFRNRHQFWPKLADFLKKV